MLDALDDRVEADELIAPMFPGGVTPEHRADVVERAPVPHWGSGGPTVPPLACCEISPVPPGTYHVRGTNASVAAPHPDGDGTRRA
jgi:hypothetical protein